MFCSVLQIEHTELIYINPTNSLLLSSTSFISFKREKQDQSIAFIDQNQKKSSSSFKLHFARSFKVFVGHSKSYYFKLLDSITIFNQAFILSILLKRNSKEVFLKPNSYLISHILELNFSLRIKLFPLINYLCIHHLEPLNIIDLVIKLIDCS